MMPETERVAPADTEGTSTFTAGGSPLSVSPICGYCMWREQWAEATSQQFLSTTRDSVDRAHVELKSRPGYSGSQCPQTDRLRVIGTRSSGFGQAEPVREATPRPEQATHKVIENFIIKMTELLETSMATRRNERVLATGADEAL
ncbi:hypothetical protein M9H77_02031 [Catharanthus roseus]|uniref:Uncharacterized protein n=1 Tax=Catharanthus roseus TaxID=4058 RepID=A0ACC0C7M7_CATRO|nr:hypothetical protein M9H77_02031 [Catharanthus roseus]